MTGRRRKQLGNYRLTRLLGSGSFSKVYLGEHVHLGTPAAIKVLRVTFVNEDVEEFRTEARTIARLVHPHIVRVLDFGLEGSIPFLVMDYAPGGTLRQRHRRGSRLPLHLVLSYVRQIASALHYAHQHQVIHRDIKPENMLLGKNNEVLLSDFGLAVVSSSSQHRSLQDIVGTIAFVAPEQLRGEPCPASDQYALAVVVYQWLCGTLPFNGSHQEVALQHLTAAPPLLREKVPSIPSEIEQVVLTALAKEPGQRFETLEAFATALEGAVLSEEPDPRNRQLPLQTSLFRAHVQIGRSQQNPLVGRDHELETLHRLLIETEELARAPLAVQQPAILSHGVSARYSSVWLLGEAGIGKTRLAEEVSREAQRRGWAVAWGRAHAQERAVPYRLWIEVLRNIWRQVNEAQSAVSRNPLLYQPLTVLLPEITDLLPQGVGPSIGLPEQMQFLLWDTMLDLLTAISERVPLLVVLDDLHWADTSSCELLGYLVRHLPCSRIFLVGTCCQAELSPAHPLRSLFADLQREQAFTPLHLSALTNEQIRTLLADVPESLVGRIQLQAAGNPFFAEELARVASSEGTVSSNEVVPTVKGRRPALPEAIASALDVRLDRLSQPCRQLLSNAAALGNSFSLSTIRLMQISQNPFADEDTILDLLEEALQAGMLTEEGSGTRITYRFWHPLLVSHLYERLSAGRRASLHRRAAEMLRQAYQGREQEGAAAIVYHLVNGGAESPQIAYYAEIAGDRAYALSAYPEAVQHYRLAVEHIESLPANASTDEHLHFANLLERLGECTRVQGNAQEARRYFEQALEVRSQHRLSTSQTNPQYEAQIDALLWIEIGKTWFDTGDYEHAQQCYSRGEEVLREAEVTIGPVWASLYLEQSYILWRKGNFEEARQTAQHALNLFGDVLQQQNHTATNAFHSTATRRTLDGDPVDLGRTNTLLATIAATIGESTIALDHLNTALTIFEQYERQREIAMVCGNIGDVYLRKAEHTLAQAAVRRSLSIAEQIGEAGIMAVDFGNLGILSARFGDLAEAEVYYKRALTLAEQVNDPIYTSLLYSYLATIMQDQGKINAAKTSLCQALRISRAMNITPCIGVALVTLGHLHIAQALADQESNSGSLEVVKQQGSVSYRHLLQRARTALQRALALEGLEAETRTEGQLAQAQASFLLGEIETARQQAMQGMEEACRLEQTGLLACARRLMGEILSAQGQREEARTYFEQALETLQKCGMRLEWARTLRSYGAAMLGEHGKDDGNYRQGLKYLGQAREVFRECNAVLDLQGVERVIDR